MQRKPNPIPKKGHIKCEGCGRMLTNWDFPDDLAHGGTCYGCHKRANYARHGVMSLSMTKQNGESWF